MTASEFKIAWNDEESRLQPVSLSTLQPLNLTQDCIAFLCEAGLPEDAAPFLSFKGDDQTKGEYYCILPLTQLYKFLPPEYNQFIAIGADGCGDPIVINTAAGCIIEWLDHEDYFSARFMNSSVAQLAACLLAYRNFVIAVQKENGDDAFIESRFNEAQIKALQDTLQHIDPRAIAEGFWQWELDSLRSGIL